MKVRILRNTALPGPIYRENQEVDVNASNEDEINEQIRKGNAVVIEGVRGESADIRAVPPGNRAGQQKAPGTLEKANPHEG